MTRWEYKILVLDSYTTEEALNELGKLGWEAFAASVGLLFLRRELFNDDDDDN